MGFLSAIAGPFLQKPMLWQRSVGEVRRFVFKGQIARAEGPFLKQAGAAAGRSVPDVRDTKRHG